MRQRTWQWYPLPTKKKAVEEEWQRQGLMEYVDVVLSQDAGSKSACINALLKKGYCPDHVLMVGDAPGGL